MSYLWVPAHCIPKYTDIQLCVTYEKNKVKHPVGSLEGKVGNTYERSIIRCPDRTLIIFTKPEYRPLDTSFDKHIDFGVFSNQTIFNNIGIGLISADIGLESVRYSIDRPKDHILIGDSGGFQLRSAKKSFLDPYEVINWMNYSNASHAVAIDVCPREYGYDKMDEECFATIEASRRNNNIYKKYKRKDLKLLNVIHGYTPEHHKIWADKLNDEDFHGWAVGSETPSIYNTWDGVLSLRESFPRDHYHFFALGATSNVYILAWMGTKVPLLTSDTTTYRNSGMAREFQLLYPSGMVRMFHVGKIKEYKEYAPTYSPCSCAVCENLKYIDVYGLESKYKTERLLTWHNMLTLHRQAKYWSELAMRSTYEEYIEAIKESMESTVNTGQKVHTRFMKIKRMLDFIEMYVQEGSKSALKKYKKELFRASNLAYMEAGHMDDFIVDDGVEKEVKGKRNLKTKNTSRLTPSISVDALPNYIPKKVLWNKYGIDPVNFDLYDEYHDQRKKIRKKLIAEKGSAELMDRLTIRKIPSKVKSQMRQQQLQELEKE